MCYNVINGYTVYLNILKVVMMMKNKTCCFIGHREIRLTDELEVKLYKSIVALITNQGVNTFLFGSKSQFNTLCHKIVTEIKKKYPKIKRVYVRAEYPYINDDYKKYLLKKYEDTYYPSKIINSGKACYVERNFEMLNKSSFCVAYYNEHYEVKSGTKLAMVYAESKGIKIINVGTADTFI